MVDLDKSYTIYNVVITSRDDARPGGVHGADLLLHGYPSHCYLQQ